MTDSIERIPSKFNLPVDLTARLAKAVPSGKRSRFVAKAINDALDADAKARLLDMLDALPSHPTSGEDPVDVLRGLRQDRTRTLTERHKPLSQ